jgi:hypothetical protein
MLCPQKNIVKTEKITLIKLCQNVYLIDISDEFEMDHFWLWWLEHLHHAPELENFPIQGVT